MYDVATQVGDVSLSGAAFGVLLARSDAETGTPVWATGIDGTGNALFGLRRFLVDRDESIHFALSVSTGPGSLFGTNAVQLQQTGHWIHVMRVNRETGALERERVITADVGTMHSNCLGFLGEDRAVYRGQFRTRRHPARPAARPPCADRL